MKKIININFHGRVIPIEETAYEILKQYVESLRVYFAKEEGKDEIINDIESRFAELFSERLKKDATCITDEDVNAIIVSMGRPEDFEQDEFAQSGAAEPRTSQTGQQSASSEPTESRRLFRSENDKILGGVCGGLANYLRIDPAIVRILFALISFGGFGAGVLIYIIMWIAVPSRNLATNIRKRLYRNPETKVIAGVASGLAAYFHIAVWIPRLLFALPLILGIITSIFRNTWFGFDPGPVFITGGFGGTLFITYVILWIVLPEAQSASEKLEMRGEKVDLESIKNTIKGDLDGFKGRAKEMGDEIRDRAQQFGAEVKKASQQFATEAGPAVRRGSSGFAHAIGVLFKAFFLFIAGIIVFALIMALISLLFSGVGFLPFRYYLLSGFWQNLLAWLVLLLFICIPILGVITWLVRRIMGVRSRSNYLGIIFGGLWTIGLISLVIFVATMVNNFRTRASVEDDLPLAQPLGNTLVVREALGKISYEGSDWFGINWGHDAPFFGLNQDSVMMSTVRINVVRSLDSSYHLRRVRFSRGGDPNYAKMLAGQIQFEPLQHDSILSLPQGFAITPGQKWRNQQVLVIVDIPVGKRIYIDRSVDDYQWFDINLNERRRGWNMDWNQNQDYSWSSGVMYVMTEDGLKSLDRNNRENEEDQPQTRSDNRYRYQAPADSGKSRPSGRPEKLKRQPAESKPAVPKKQADSTAPPSASRRMEIDPVESYGSPIYILSA
jgi:phage shock protein PspC (stress-responsive transcriptional regulator)